MAGRSDPWPGDHRNARRWARGLTPCAPASGSDLGPRWAREPSNDRPGSDLVGIHGCEVRPLAGRSSKRAQMGQRSDPVRTGLGVRPRAAMPARTVERSTRGLTSSRQHGWKVRPLAGRSSQRAQMGQRSDLVRTGLGVRPRAAMPARTVERSTRGLTSSGDTVARSDPWPGDHRNARRWARGLTPCAPASGSDLGPRWAREPSNDRPGV